MRLHGISVLYVCDNDIEKVIAIDAMFQDNKSPDDCHVSLEADTKMIYLWNELEQHIKAKLAERLGLEEPIHKAITPNEGIQKMEWSSPSATEDYKRLS